MTRMNKPKATVIESADEANVRAVATRALAILARGSAKRAPADIEDRFLELSDAFISLDPEEAKDELDRLLRSGMGVSDVIDHIIPETARLLGQRWMDDGISFADVSIGSSRLQETVRRLRARDRGSLSGAGPDTKVLLIVPRPEQHTLGVFVAADQLRRQGLTVSLSIADRPRDVALEVRNGRYRMIGITASGVRTLASVKELVEAIRRSSRHFAPIVLGGPIVGAELTGLDSLPVDFMTTDICAAARRCGLLPTKTEISEGTG